MAAVTVAAVLFIVPRLATAQARQTASTAQAQHSGWLEGTVLTAENKAVTNPYNCISYGLTLHEVRQGGGEFTVTSDKKMGGLYLYVAQSLKPGLYEISVMNGYTNNGDKLRSQRIHGVLIKPGGRMVLNTVLNVVMEPGEALEEVGKPVVSAEPATAGIG